MPEYWSKKDSLIFLFLVFFAATFSTFVFSSLFVMHPKLQIKPITELGTFEADQSSSQQ